MCHPTDPRAREAMLRRAPRELTIARHSEIEELPEDLSEEFHRHYRQASLAGALTLSLAHFGALERRAKGNAVLGLARELAVEWAQTAVDLPELRHCDWRLPPEDAEIAGSFRRYRAVSPLWATMVYSRIRLQPDLQPQSRRALPAFLSYAQEIARLASALRWSDDDADLKLPRDSLWQFVMPPSAKWPVDVRVVRGGARPLGTLDPRDGDSPPNR